MVAVGSDGLGEGLGSPSNDPDDSMLSCPPSCDE
ncbi:unnamed protein product, partial [Protopolystoma xenopodis]